MPLTRAELKAITRERIKLVKESNKKFLHNAKEYVLKEIMCNIKTGRPSSLEIVIDLQTMKSRLADPDYSDQSPCHYIGDESEFLSDIGEMFQEMHDDLGLEVDIREPPTEDEYGYRIKEKSLSDVVLTFDNSDSVFDSSSESESGSGSESDSDS
jgi:hypothetical protein